MSLATRCTSCGIVFRVVQDQLKVSEGWVRCGRCDAVFNALEALFDLERDPPPEWAPSSAPSTDGPGLAEAPMHVEPGMEREIEPAEAARIDERLFKSRAFDGAAAASRIRQEDRNDFEDARFNVELMLDDAAPPEADSPAVRVSSAPAAPFAQDRAAASAEPRFLQQAERHARWQRPGVRAALWSAAGLLLLGLSLQVLHQFRQVIAAEGPTAKSLVAAWCAAIGCTVEAPRRIGSLSVESTGLTQASPGSTNYRLAISLRNRGRTAVAMPWIELSISDANGQLLSRRALQPRDFAVAVSAVAAGSDVALATTLATAEQKVSGYSVELFYP